jgi:quinoprotein glucose dehydrogenase
MKAAFIRCLPIALALSIVPRFALHAQKTTNWAEYLGGPSSAHYSPVKQVNTRNVDKLEVAWSYPTGDQQSYYFSPLVVDNVAYVAAKQGTLVALDATTGKEMWAHSFESGGRFSGIGGQRGANYWESQDR